MHNQWDGLSAPSIHLYLTTPAPFRLFCHSLCALPLAAPQPRFIPDDRDGREPPPHIGGLRGLGGHGDTHAAAAGEMLFRASISIVVVAQMALFRRPTQFCHECRGIEPRRPIEHLSRSD